MKPMAKALSADNVARLLKGESPEAVSGDLAARISKYVKFKAPVALRISNEIIDQQVGTSIEEAVEIELGRLTEIFSTADALMGLSNVGRRVEFKGN
jgi:enoyl-CoA hydratase/3-hydroxyacyl-CoA dehydrogenase